MINVVFILDETGSMSYNKVETVQAFNTYIKELRKHKKAKDIRFTLTRFNSSKVDIYYDKVKLSKVKELTDYSPNNMTPLYDAIGKTITDMHTDKCIVAILTDGEENCSREYTFLHIKALIEEKKVHGWEFNFLATGLEHNRVANTGRLLDINTYSGASSAKLSNVFYLNTLSYIDTDLNSLE